MQDCPEATFSDPMHGLSAAEFAAALGIGDEELRRLEHERQVFSVVRPAFQRGREYPAFQSWPSIAGAPLQEVLQLLAELDSADSYGFFAGVTDLLVGLTPVEVLMGKPVLPRTLESEAVQLLNASLQPRMKAVACAAQALVCLRAA